MKWGNSQGILLPKHLLESAGISTQDTLEIVAKTHCIIIRKTDRQLRKTIRERFEGFSGTYDTGIFDYGGPKGKEIW